MLLPHNGQSIKQDVHRSLGPFVASLEIAIERGFRWIHGKQEMDPDERNEAFVAALHGLVSNLAIQHAA